MCPFIVPLLLLLPNDNRTRDTRFTNDNILFLHTIYKDRVEQRALLLDSSHSAPVAEEEEQGAEHVFFFFELWQVEESCRRSQKIVMDGRFDLLSQADAKRATRRRA